MEFPKFPMRHKLEHNLFNHDKVSTISCYERGNMTASHTWPNEFEKRLIQTQYIKLVADILTKIMK